MTTAEWAVQFLSRLGGAALAFLLFVALLVIWFRIKEGVWPWER